MEGGEGESVKEPEQVLVLEAMTFHSNLQSLLLRWAGEGQVGPCEEEEEKDKEEPVMETILFTQEPVAALRPAVDVPMPAPGTDC